MTDNQDMLDRMVVVITPKKVLVDMVSELIDQEDLTEFTKPHVLMTDEIDFEESIEGCEESILDKFKVAFLMDEFEYGALSELENLEELLGQTDDLIQCFDQWWVAKEAGYTQIDTDWDDED